MQHDILVLDSGVGGLSVCESILQARPDVKIIYLADKAYFPYGILSESTLQERVVSLVERLVALHSPKLVVIACNTVSTILLPELRSRFEIPFVGVVPAIKPASQVSQTRSIGVLATPATVTRNYLDDLIQEFANDCDVTKVGSEKLVWIAEALLLEGELDESELKSILRPFRQADDLDTMVLGCTHFPLVKGFIQSILPEVRLVDSGKAIARRVNHLLSDEGRTTHVNRNDESEPLLDKHLLYFTDALPEREFFSKSLSQLGFDNFELRMLSI